VQFAHEHDVPSLKPEQIHKVLHHVTLAFDNPINISVRKRICFCHHISADDGATCKSQMSTQKFTRKHHIDHAHRKRLGELLGTAPHPEVKTRVTVPLRFRINVFCDARRGHDIRTNVRQVQHSFRI